MKHYVAAALLALQLVAATEAATAAAPLRRSAGFLAVPPASVESSQAAPPAAAAAPPAAPAAPAAAAAGRVALPVREGKAEAEAEGEAEAEAEAEADAEIKQAEAEKADTTAEAVSGKTAVAANATEEEEDGDEEQPNENQLAVPAPAPQRVEVANTANTTNRTTPPPGAPYHWAYDETDAVARDVEERHGADFYPEGTHKEVDMPVNEQHKIDSIFNQEPSIFTNCVLIRDFAEPLRVGSAIMDMSARRQRLNESLPHLDSGSAASWLGAASMGVIGSWVSKGNGGADAETNSTPKYETKLPASLLLPKGGVSDKDTNDGALQINMFAFLRSVAGEVAVIPNGHIAKWGSKRKVPIAGYLCTSPAGPVLHTLSTPCLPTAVGEDGEPFSPPDSLINAGYFPSPGPAPAPASAADKAADAEAASAEAEAEGEKPATAILLGKAPSASPAVPPGLAQEIYPYHVWVGGQRLQFSSKPKADKFCVSLSEKIANDLGDTEWDTDLDELKESIAKQPDPSVTAFAQVARKAGPEWTLGTKKLIVVVMDWMNGDRSAAPFSQQKTSPAHYRDTIFPKVRAAFQRMSFGLFDIDVTVVPEVIPYTRPRSRYMAEGFPFPGLYNGARSSLEANVKYGRKYNFDQYDLAYVISPQQQPIGTKGVAWVGAKGAMCNGCEEISESFQTMVAIHELGHNLGLFHASSVSLEYGNVYDWMGNYPDVEGLSYGLGYKLALKWLPNAAIPKILDADVANLNDEYILRPFDMQDAPKEGEIAGLRFRLGGNTRDLYVAYRDTTGLQAGVYLTWQDQEKPSSQLIDCTCNSPSQQDSRLQQGWTYMDPAGKIVIYVASVDEHSAVIRIFKAPDKAGVASIRARDTFTDGQWKCPRSCQDADLLVSQYKGCGGLSQDGYCNGGSITMGGKKYSVGLELCPESCDKCEEVLRGPSTADSCQDKNIKIGGMSCPQAASSGYCDRNTNIGSVGQDLCPMSCGKCPPRPPAASKGPTAGFQYPKPARTHGSLGAKTSKEEAAKPTIPPDEGLEEPSVQADKLGSETTAAPQSAPSCTDNNEWKDADGDGCSTYASYIADGNMSQADACKYNEGAALNYCRSTCDSCDRQDLNSPPACEDKECVSSWKTQHGKCFVCSDWPALCQSDPAFRTDCPVTCGTCEGAPKKEPTIAAYINASMLRTTSLTTTTTLPEATPAPECKDQECVAAWLNETKKCYRCQDFAEDFCGRDADFMASCPQTCKTCDPDVAPTCADSFMTRTCRRYVSWGWCSKHAISKHCKSSCGICPGSPGAEAKGGQKNAARQQAPLLLSLILFALTAIASAH